MSEPGEQKRKSIIKTFRLAESLARSLEQDAAEEGTTANSLVNRIIQEYYGWGKKGREFGLVSVHMPIIARLIEEADDDTLVRLGKEVIVNTWKEMAMFWLHDDSPVKMLEVLGLRSRLDRKTESTITQDKGTYTIVFRNDYGPRFSIACESALREFVRESFHVEPMIKRGDAIVTARFKIPPRNSPV